MSYIHTRSLNSFKRQFYTTLKPTIRSYRNKVCDDSTTTYNTISMKTHNAS